MKKIQPPHLAKRLLERVLREDLTEEVLGDLEEKYSSTLKNHSASKAKMNYWFEVINYLRPFAIRKINSYHYMNHGLFQNYFKVGIRNILKYKTFSFINIFGLAVAMSVGMLLILMLADQHRYDQFHEKKDRMYRILSSTEDGRQGYATSPFPLSHALKESYPIIEESTHLTPGVGGDATYQQKLAEMRGYFAEPSFFRVFGFRLEKGDEKTALMQPNSAVISSELAYELFNDENPVGKIIEFSDRQLSFPLEFDGISSPAVSWGSFTITGVIDHSKYKSHLAFDALVSAATLPALYSDKKIEDRSSNWENYYRTYTYVVLRSDAKEDQLSNALDDFVKRTYADLTAEHLKGFHLTPQPLSQVQLGLMGNDTNNRLFLLGYYFLAALTIVILISAALNYTSLSIARSVVRAKEIGIRKVNGAQKKSVVMQFLSESILISLFAMVLAVGLLFLLKPAFKNLWVNQYLGFELPQTWGVYFLFIGFAMFIGILAGLFPAFQLSAYEPVKVLKKLQVVNRGGMGMRKALNVSQLVISLFFIATSVLVFRQFNHFMKFDYGFDSTNIINVELQGAAYEKVVQQFSTVPGVVSVSASDIIPATGTNNGIQLKKTDSENEFTNASILVTDQHFIENLNIKLVAGSALSESSTTESILINETAVEKLGYPNPASIIGESLETKWGGETLTVVGVVKNFHYLILVNNNGTAPLVLRRNPDQFKFLNVRLAGDQPMTTISKLEAKWKEIDPLHPIQYKFFKDELASTHQAIFDIVTIIGFVAFLAIVIACLGLLGMATYTIERKTKEVGIRKTLGATEFNIAFLLSREFIAVVLMAVAIGAPLSFFVNNLWLQRLVNRVDFGWSAVGIGTLCILLLGFITIVTQTLKASRTNPVDSLKVE
ncbi:MAG: ABC transporter permease [Cyclobacteriaceae bacterium]